MSRKAEVAWQCAVFGAPVFPLDVHPLDGVALLDVVHILEEVQVQVEAIGCLHRVRDLLPLAASLGGFGGIAICYKGEKKTITYPACFDRSYFICVT